MSGRDGDGIGEMEGGPVAPPIASAAAAAAAEKGEVGARDENMVVDAAAATAATAAAEGSSLPNNKIDETDGSTAKVAAEEESKADGGDGGGGDDDVQEKDATLMEDRSAWDFSHRKVLIQGVNKYDDQKKMRKAVSSWIREINDKEGESAGSAGVGGGTPGTERKQQQGEEEAGDPPSSVAPPKKRMKKLEFTKIKKPPKDCWAVVTLGDESMVEPFIDYVNNHRGGLTNKRGNRLFAKRTTDSDDAGGGGGGDRGGGSRRKRKSKDGSDRDDSGGDGRDGVANKRQRKAMTPEEVRAARRPVSDDEIRDKSTPLWRLSMEDQISSKSRELVFKSALRIVKDTKARFR